LYHLDTKYYVLKLRDRAATVTFTELPESCQRACMVLHDRTGQILLQATSPSGRSPIVLVADKNMVSAWAQSERTGKWCEWPEFVKGRGRRGSLRLEWFAERSGLVLVTAPDSNMFLLDLRSKDIIKCSSTTTAASRGTYPYEMDVSSWVPTFTKIF
jgi:hypothetical protein